MTETHRNRQKDKDVDRRYVERNTGTDRKTKTWTDVTLTETHKNRQTKTWTADVMLTDT